MHNRTMIAGIVAIGLGTAGMAHAQTATAPTTSPPERMNGSTTMNNPATATTPQPGNPGVAGAPLGTGLGTPGDTAATPRSGTAASATPPVSGANSFTEGQAKSRLEDSGFAQISDLKLDNQGIWRGKAMKDGKTVTVSLDFKGNVVSQ